MARPVDPIKSVVTEKKGDDIVIKLRSYPELTYILPIERRGLLTEAIKGAAHVLHEKVRERLGRNEFKQFSKQKNIPLAEKLLETRKTEACRIKLPQSTDKYIGVELEFITPLATSDGVAEKLAKRKLHAYTHVHEDGSVTTGDDDMGLEVSVLAKESEIKDIVSKVADCLREDCEGYINATCGLHVHLDVRQCYDGNFFEKVGKVYKNLVMAHNQLIYMLPKSRRDNRFCRKNPSPNHFPPNRYRMVNTESIKKYGTIEVRSHSGTLDPEKICNWIDILRAVCAAPERKRAPKTLRSFFNWVKVEKKLEDYILARVDQFRGMPAEAVSQLNSFGSYFFGSDSFGIQNDGGSGV